MICPPCRKGVHLGSGLVHIIEEVCKGGTWCDCSHQPRKPEEQSSA